MGDATANLGDKSSKVLIFGPFSDKTSKITFVNLKKIRFEIICVLLKFLILVQNVETVREWRLFYSVSFQFCGFQPQKSEIEM